MTLARCALCGAPLVMTVGLTVWTVRCSHCHRLVEVHEVFAEGWFAEP